MPGGPDDLIASETTFGNFTLACLVKDIGVDQPDRRFDFMEDEENIHIDDVIATILGTPQQTTLASVAIAGSGMVSPTSTPTFSGSIARFSARYYQVHIDPAVVSVRVSFAAGSGLTSSIVQLVLVDEDGHVRDICRSDRPTYSKTVANLRNGKRLDHIAMIVVGAASAGSYTIGLQAQAATPDVMVTRWHSVPTQEYEVDSRAWTWVSPDIWVDTNGDGLRDPEVFFDENNALFVRLTNKGTADASGVSVAFDYQDATGGLLASNYIPVTDKNGVVQTLTGLSLPARTTQAFSVSWAPSPTASKSNHFCVRVRVTCPGDPNTDNKRAMSNFGNVVVDPNAPFSLMSLIRRNLGESVGKINTVLTPRLPSALTLFQPDVLAINNDAPMLAGEQRLDQIAIQYRPNTTDDVGHVHERTVPATRAKRLRGKAARDERIRTRLGRIAEPWPTIDERTLPPGAAGLPTVTVTHVDEHGVPQGGVTFTVTLAHKA